MKLYQIFLEDMNIPRSTNFYPIAFATALAAVTSDPNNKGKELKVVIKEENQSDFDIEGPVVI